MLISFLGPSWPWSLISVPHQNSQRDGRANSTGYGWIDINNLLNDTLIDIFALEWMKVISFLCCDLQNLIYISGLVQYIVLQNFVKI